MTTLLTVLNDPADASPARGETRNAKPLVLIVEDHDDTRFLLQYLLETCGCRVALATDGEEAIRVAERELPALVLMDISLPRLDGLAATRRMRELAALHEVPIVFLSGHAQPTFRAAALANGGSDYLVKPLMIRDLESVVEKHLGISTVRRKSTSRA